MEIVGYSLKWSVGLLQRILGALEPSTRQGKERECSHWPSESHGAFPLIFLSSGQLMFIFVLSLIFLLRSSCPLFTLAASKVRVSFPKAPGLRNGHVLTFLEHRGWRTWGERSVVTMVLDPWPPWKGLDF